MLGLLIFGFFTGTPGRLSQCQRARHLFQTACSPSAAPAKAIRSPAGNTAGTRFGPQTLFCFHGDRAYLRSATIVQRRFVSGPASNFDFFSVS